MVIIMKSNNSSLSKLHAMRMLGRKAPRMMLANLKVLPHGCPVLSQLPQLLLLLLLLIIIIIIIIIII
jgi:hypothetical protein